MINIDKGFCITSKLMHSELGVDANVLTATQIDQKRSI